MRDNASSLVPVQVIGAYIIFMMLPGGLNVVVAGVRLELYRIFLLVIFLFYCVRIIRFARIEPLLFLYVLWSSLGFLYNHGFGVFQTICILFLEVFVGYFIGTCFNGSGYASRKIFKLLGIVFLMLVPFAILEAMNGQRITHIFASKLTGSYASPYLGDSYYRFGMHRASVVFSHPILYSVCAAFLLPLFMIFTKGYFRILSLFALLVAIVTSVTSAGVLMLLIYSGVYFLRVISKYIPKIFKIVSWGALLVFAFLSVASDRGPIGIFIGTMSFNKHTAYARYNQWVIAFDDVMNNFFFGIGFNDWSRPFWMSDSIDSFWLMTALQNGVVAFLLLFAFVLKCLVRYWKNWRLSGENLYFMFFLAVFALVFAGFTVDFFDRAQLFFFFILGFLNSFSIDKSKKGKAVGSGVISSLPRNLNPDFKTSSS